MQGLKKTLQVIINVVLWVLIVVIAFFAIVTFSRKGNGDVARIFGFTPMTVLSDSMAPTFHTDDLIVVKQGEPTVYQEGDIISFWTAIEGRRSINTHRIVSVYRDDLMVQYTTKGDANLASDSYVVSPPDVIGRYVFSVPILGKILALLSSSVGFLVLIVLPILAFFLYQLYRLILVLIEIKRQTVIEATKAAMAEVDAQRAQQPPHPEPTAPPAERPEEEN